MIIDSLCPPAVLYLGFSLIQIIIDLFRGQQNSAFLKVIVMIIFTILLNQLCIGGLTILSWFIVFIPFIMMTYVTTILLYVFGLNPSKINNSAPDPRRRHPPHPYNPQDVGGCAGTEFGCCPDAVTASNEYGSNCYGPSPSSGPQPAPPHKNDHHGHYYPPTPGPSPSPMPDPTLPPTPPAPIKSRYSCVSIGGMKGCKLDPTGNYDDISKCKKECSSNPATPTATPSATTTVTTAAPVPPNATLAPTAAPTAAPLCWTHDNAQKKGQCMGGWIFDGNDSCTAPAGSNSKCSPYSLSGMAGYSADSLNDWVNQCGKSNPPGCQ